MNRMYPGENTETTTEAVPECPVFGECGGCQYQDISYDGQLRIKEEQVNNLLMGRIPSTADVEPICASPEPYYYRNRLDLSMLRTKDQQIHIGFKPEGRFRTLEVDRCAIAQNSINQYLPELRREVAEKITPKYRIASLVLKTGDDGRVKWGGMGKRSLRLQPADYLWTEVDGKKIYYSLDSFFQSNSSILPDLSATLKRWHDWNPKQDVLLDLYGGVGLFSILLSDQILKSALIEENVHATTVAEHNKRSLNMNHLDIYCGRVEDFLTSVLEENSGKRFVGMIDPPRKGLTKNAIDLISGIPQMNTFFYLSCNPESFAKNTEDLRKNGWQISRLRAFDFFPQTRHIEVLARFDRHER